MDDRRREMINQMYHNPTGTTVNTPVNDKKAEQED
jgi:hypothetical protein